MDENDAPYTNCPYCGERVDPADPEAIYGVKQVETLAMGPTRQIVDGMGGFFTQAVHRRRSDTPGASARLARNRFRECGGSV